ncbi:MAG TPA: SMP-30/gluconolactonase/LRE family protein [Oscillatoriaceae cyanobacterium M33_DOE_052]|uniref:SMP-30/gluconolactonase/LRE family protein n=1 Tax=Planktothricoides sp. SpSt-374 TaxID=2282167 RepID=A0A7C3VGP7_9CYAN|nr:SMP-30/gluconolactonase/LRE family protein [Oscillatoriaceae cyanobacterium M33_DOE_052]
MEEMELIADYQCHNAENPMWHPLEQKLYWTDIPTGRMFRYDPANRTSEQIYAGEPVGGMALQEDGSLLLFKMRGAIERWQDGKITTLISELPEERDTRFNDAIADPAGRVFTGTMQSDTHFGSLYRLDTDGTLTKVLAQVDIPNGMGFTRDLKQMYYTDSPKRQIYIFDYDITTGNLSNMQVFITTPEGEGVPDGMTVDAEGYIWSGRWDGGHLFRYAPDGREVLRIPFPAKKVSSLTFGGPDWTDIYVTTAGGDNRAENGPGAGAVFRLNLGIKGVPEFFSKIGL